MIEFEHVSFAYASRPVLEDISLRIPAGEQVAIIGSTGSGKSTLARLIGALHTPTSGVVRVGGIRTDDEAHLSALHAQIGMVFQNPDDQIISNIVSDDVAFGPRNLGLSEREIRERVTEALERVGLSDCAQKEVSALSGGQKQRLALAGALAMNPRILVLDEATCMLDPASRHEVDTVIERLHAAGMTIVSITHDMEQAARCTRVIVLHAGRVRADGAPEAVLGNDDVMSQAGLEPPFAVQLTRALHSRGIEIPPTLDLSLCEEALCHLFSRG